MHPTLRFPLHNQMIKLEKTPCPSDPVRALLPSASQSTPAETFHIDGNQTLVSSRRGNSQRPLHFAPSDPAADLPDRRGKFSDPERDNILCLLGSPDGRFGSLKINARVQIHTCQLGTRHQITYRIKDGHDLWLRCDHGGLDLNGLRVAESHSATVTGEKELVITALSDSEFLLLLLW